MSDEKLVRIPGETLLIKFSPDELTYREKYLPDCTKLTDEKLVCTVCSKNLASDVHKGKDIFVHRVLNVLVCEFCYNFYGDGNFSVDEDGDDKYCRWCGQGGTLYLCSTCSCAFCQKCVKQNLKASVIAELEKDDWKCYICNPRPLFGTRTICWGAQEMNKMGKEKERERLRKLEEKKKEDNERKSRKASSDGESTKNKRKRSIDSDSTSPEVIPSKKPRRNSKASQNGFGKGRRRRKSSSDESSEDKEISKRSRNRTSSKKKNVSYAESSSEDESDSKQKRLNKLKKKKHRDMSDESSEDKKSKNSRKNVKKTGDSSDDSSDEEKTKNKKGMIRKKLKDDSDLSSDEKRKKKKSQKVKPRSSSDDSSEDKKRKSIKKPKKSKNISSEEDSDSTKRISKSQKSDRKSKSIVESDSDSKKSKGKGYNESIRDASSKNITTDSHAEDKLMKKRIKLAVVWLSNAARDIAELGNLISVRAEKFKQKKINTDNLKTYEDVIKTVNKVKQLIAGVHSNYEHIEKNLEAQLRPWKILTGIEEVETKTLGDNEIEETDTKTNSLSVEEQSNDTNKEATGSLQSSQNHKSENSINKEENVELQWSGDDDSDNEKQNFTKDLISKANETLDKMEEEEEEENTKVDKPQNEKKSKTKTSDEDMTLDLVEETDAIKENQKVDHVSDSTVSPLKDSLSESDGPVNKGVNKNGETCLSKPDSNKKEKAESVKKVDENKENPKENLKSNSNNSKSAIEEDSDADEELLSNENYSEKVLKKKSQKRRKSVVRVTRKSVKEKSEPTEEIKESQCSEEINSTSSESSLKTFGEKIKHKWDSAENPEDMKLIAPLGSDLSEEEQESNDKSGTKRKEKDSSEESDPPKGSTATKSRPKRLTTKKQKTSDTPVKENNPRKGLKCEKPEQGVSIKEPEKKSDKNKSLVKKTSNTTLSSESEDNSEGEKQNKVHLKHKKKKESYSKEKGNSSKNTLDSDDSGSIDNHDSKKKNNLASRKKSKVQSNQRLSSGSEEDFDSKSKPEIEKSTIEENENDTHVTNGKNRESKEGSIRNSPEKESKDNIKNKKKVSPKTSEDCDTNGKKRESKGGSVRKSPEKEIKDNVKNKEKVSTKPNENSSEISLAEVKEESDSEHLIESEVESVPVSKKFVSLGSSSEDESTKTSVVKTCDRKKKAENETATTNKGKNQPKNVFLLDSSDEENEPEADKPNNLPILLQSSDEENESPVGKTKDKSKSSVASGSIENLSSAASSDEEIFRKKNTRTKKSKSSDSDFEEGKADKNKKKRKLVRCASSSNDSDESGDGEGGKSRKGSGKSPGKGRKNIKKIKKDVAESTKEAAEEEKERRKRIEDRQKLFNQVFEVKESKTLDKLVLDFDAENKKELLSVNPDLVAKMKPHQAKGVKFMWDSCFESISDCKKKKGSGCILAHCMGLGKTFQVISLVHTLLMNEDTQVRTVMVVCPLSTVLNWYNEFDKWLDNIEGGSSIDVYHLTRLKSNPERARELRHWQNTGGVLIMGYEMFRNLTAETAKKFRAKMKKDFQETLVDPGADIIVCDEGHMLKNEQTALSKAMGRVRTLRRIVLTGTPMQNNLVEYHCMVQFVKPNLLGTKKEFLNRFVNPITNGQFVDSTERDVSIMKRRAHVLHKMLEGLVQRFDYNVLTPFLPPKHEYVVSICLSELQVKMYQHYLDNYSQRSDKEKAGSRLFQDWQALGRIWTHPRVVKISSDRAAEKRAMLEESDEEGSLKDFIDDSDEETTSESESESAGSGSGSAKCNAKKRRVVQTRRKTRSNATNDAHLESEEEENAEKEVEENQEKEYAGAWWSEFLKPEDLNDIRHSGKLMLLFGILKESEMIEDKVLVFSQSLFSLDLIEYFLDKIDAATQEDRLDESLGNHQGNWSKGLDYFRLDGSTSSDNRNLWCKAFNREDNPRARLFLISTRAGGLGINLTAANRVIIFDASWNPSHDVQSIFRVYRFGQKKPCYVYRFIASGTMEEKVYDRQVAKQSISNRVVDEQQVHRHFTSSDLNELYTFTPPSKPEDRPTPALPKDVLMAELLAQFKDWIEKYHEHDSLLENVAEEELNEEERKLAWEDYETEKKRGFLPNYANNAPGQANNSMHMQIEIMRQNLKTKFPTMPEPELNQMLIQQVSMLMRHQHMLQQQQKMAQQQYQQQQMAAKVMQMRQQQQQAQLQMKQMYQKVPASVLMNQQAGGNAGVQPSLLSSFLNMPSRSNMQMPGMSAPYPQMTPNFKEMEKMRQRYMASKNPGVVITEVTDETPKPSSS